MNGRQLYLSFLLCLLFGYSLAQEHEEIAEQIIGDDIQENEELQDFTELKEKLNFFVLHPLDLNTATENDFEKLGFLTCFKIAMILEYRELHGPFLSTNELSGVDGLSLKDVNMLLPFVMAGNVDINPVTKKLFLQQLQFTQGYNFPLSKGFVADSIGNTRYTGDPFYTRIKYRLESNNLFAGFMAEKDAGESLREGYDFYSAFVEYNGKQKLRTLIAGDYRANFGQGLVLWNGFSLGKSSNVANIRRMRQGFSHYTSTNENLYFRGIAASVEMGHFTLSFMGSYKKVDATKGNEEDEQATYVTSWKTSGLHALSTDIRDRKLLGEKNAGGNISFNMKNFQLGVTGIQTNYNLPVIPENTIANLKRFTGKSWNAYGFDYLLKGRKYECFGEIAGSSNGGYAGTGGIQLVLPSETFFSALYRNFAADYFSAYANSFAQDVKTNNEEGFYFGLELNPLAGIRMNCSADFYKNALPSFTVHDQQTASQYLFETHFQPNQETSFSLRYTFQNRRINAIISDLSMTKIIGQEQQKIRLKSMFKLSTSIEIRNSIELNFLEKISIEKQNGVLVYQDILWKSASARISFAFRYLFFNTDGWDSRLYAYENDLINSFSFPAFYGKGTSMNFTSQIRVYRKIKCSFRYNRISYSDREKISSGVSEIDSGSKNELSCQLLFLF